MRTAYFGVHGIEYWMIMEAGKMDLLAWRNNPAPNGRKKRPPSFYSPSTDWRSFEGVSPGGVDVDVPFTGSGGEWNVGNSQSQSQRQRLSMLSDLNLNLKIDLDTCDECQTDEELPSGGDGDPNCSEKDPLTLHKLAVCLALFADALLIVQSVHSSRVLHFDIKCANFILRCEPDLDVMYRSVPSLSPYLISSLCIHLTFRTYRDVTSEM